ncbi:MAG TPA: flippase [bacterium]|jgi:O-antigen/teichoic acid export membrane protein|nr:flippase [bacterium]HOG38019.1 flippase [bacterium]
MDKSPSNKIVKNTGYFTGALILQKIISFIYFSYLATQLGAENTAQYFFALSFSTIFSVFVDFGLANLINREIAKNQESDQKLLSNAMGIKLLNSVFVFIIIIFTSKILGYSNYLIKMILLSSLIMILDNFTSLFFAILRGKHNLKYESISSVAFQIIVAFIGYVILQTTKDPFTLLFALLFASTINLIYSSFIISSKYKLSIKASFDKKFIKILLIAAFPFAISSIFTRISGNIDSVILSKMSTQKALGCYALAYKITFAFQFIPMAFSASLYPAFTHFYNYEKEKLYSIFNKSLKYLLLISMSISFGIIAVAYPVILKIYGKDFLDSVLTLKILILNLPFIFLTFPTGAFLNACNLQKIHTKNIGIMMITSIILNFILIPIYAQNGAAIASVLSSILYLVLNINSSIRKIEYKSRELIINFVKILLACGIMYIVVIFTNKTINLIVAIIFGIFSYILSILLLKILDKTDTQTILSIFLKKNKSQADNIS